MPTPERYRLQGHAVVAFSTTLMDGRAKRAASPASSGPVT
jgi:hypothetical protein